MDETRVAGTPVAAEVHGLRKRLGSFELRDVNLTLPAGYVTGLVGPNGSGKTTLIRSMLGLVRPDAGQIRVLGSVDGATADRVGVVLDQVTAAPAWRAGRVSKHVRPLFPRWDEIRFSSLLERFDVPTQSRVGELSRGQSVKLAMAMALAHDPLVLILDEPSSGLDPVARRELTDVIREFMLDGAHTALFSTHITTDLDNLADHLIVMSRGTIAYQGTLEQAREQFAVVSGDGPVSPAALAAIRGLRRSASGWFQGLIDVADSALFGAGVELQPATTDDLVVGFAGPSASHAGLWEERGAA
ncbi:ABC transporter ATP-binding protein [Microbacterium protaetiae]|uniref:ABC transporter ATP-binding protein n=1 Tax=Microbacterium protaetiae TaxID=2509458 RepID=UPI0013EA9647|nr:ABC transporter ATP-binding protein [Microbacterium protaetiae]